MKKNVVLSGVIAAMMALSPLAVQEAAAATKTTQSKDARVIALLKDMYARYMADEKYWEKYGEYPKKRSFVYSDHEKYVLSHSTKKFKKIMQDKWWSVYDGEGEVSGPEYCAKIPSEQAADGKCYNAYFFIRQPGNGDVLLKSRITRITPLGNHWYKYCITTWSYKHNGKIEEYCPSIRIIESNGKLYFDDYKEDSKFFGEYGE